MIKIEREDYFDDGYDYFDELHKIFFYKIIYETIDLFRAKFGYNKGIGICDYLTDQLR